MDYKKEVKRAVFHIGLGLFIVILSFFLSVLELVALLSAILIIGLFISIISRKRDVPIVCSLLGTFEREECKNFPGKGSFYFIAGCLFALLLFETQIALASIMILAFGDSFAKIMGHFGKIKTRFHAEKKLEGTAIGIIAGILAAMWFVTPVQAFFGTLIAMTGEYIDFEYLQINDNVLIPVVAGIFMTLLKGF